MKKSFAVRLTMAAAMGIIAAGCNKSTNSPATDVPPAGVTDEQSAMQAAAVSDAFVANDEQAFADQEIEPTDYADLAGRVTTGITPLRWGRFITSVTRQTSVAVQPGDTIAVVHIHKTIVGVLKIKGIESNDTVTVQKPFTDLSDRNVVFKRVARAAAYWRNWVPVATSLVKGESQNSSDINITQLTIMGPNDTVTVTDPLNYWMRYRWLGIFNRGNSDVATFTGGDSVKVQVTLTSTSTDTDLVALRFGFDGVYKNRAKMNLVSQNGNVKVFERQFYVHPRPGMFNAAIESATRATLYDDSPTAYAVSWWGIPYRVL